MNVLKKVSFHHKWLLIFGRIETRAHYNTQLFQRYYNFHLILIFQE